MIENIIPVILCGGSGSRLWPASRERHPKQFLHLTDDFSLLQNTARRALRVAGCDGGSLVTVTLRALAGEVITQLAEIDSEATRHVLCEPAARNTAAAVAFAALYVDRIFGKDAMMWILPADHHIGDESALADAFRLGLLAAKRNHLTTFGIRPNRPETGYGYIRQGRAFLGGSVHKADAFIEKPDAATASAYIEAGNYLWNSGMFLFSTNTLLNEYETHAADILKAVRAMMDNVDLPRQAVDQIYAAIPDRPFDKAIMEKSSRVAIVPCDPLWSDIGSWESLWELREKDADGNVIEGRAACHDTHNCLIQAGNRLIACAGMDNIVVIETADAVLIADRHNGDAMRALVKTLKDTGCYEVTEAVAANRNAGLFNPGNYA